MDTQTFYLVVNGDYVEVFGRLGNDERICKYLRKFAETTTYDEMMNALSEKDWETAFRASHNLKGMTANLSLTALYRSSSELCENLRKDAQKVDLTPLVQAVTQDYLIVMDGISALD